MRQKLTSVAIDRLPHPEKGSVKYWDTVVPGFGVRVSSRTKSFFLMFGSDRRLTTFGKWPDMTLKDARQEAKRLQVHDAPKKLTERLSAARAAYLKECEAKNRPNTVRMYRQYLHELDKTNLSDITRHDVDLGDSHRVTAWKVFFNWCIRNELVEKNPFAFATVTYPARSRVLSSSELRQVWAYEYPPYSDYLKLLILTGQRRGQFQDCSIDGEHLHFPATVMKGKRAHTIPLTPWTRSYIEKLQPYSGWSNAKRRLDKQLQLPHFTLHDLRRTFATVQASLGTPVHVTEAILAHSSGQVSGVTAIYNRYDYLKESREALDRYEAWLQAVMA